MDIKRIKTAIDNYISGKASAEEKTWIERWLGKAEKEALRTSDKGRYLHIKEQILYKLRAHIAFSTPLINQRKKKRQRIIKSTYALAAFLTLCLGCYQYWYSILDWVNPVKQVTVTASSCVVKQVMLPDSSVVSLNTSGSLSYPEYFRGRKREVVLNGEAFFEVTKNTDQPFVVNTNGLKVKVLGTSFVVADHTKKPNTSVSVKTGKVSVKPYGLKATVLLPNQTLLYDKAAHTQKLNTGIRVNTAWTNNRFLFRSTRLKEVFEALENQFDVNIEVAEPVIQNLTFTGKFNQDDSLYDILQIINLSHNLNINLENKPSIYISMDER